jgi:DNA-binding NtrC family response regulator
VSEDPKHSTSSGLETERGGPIETQDRRISIVLYHRDGAKVMPLAAGVPVVIGRAWPADAVVSDPRLSRQHARVLWDGEAVTVEDLGSTNGTFLDGAPVQRARFTAADEVTLGSVTVSLHELSPREEVAHTLDGHERFQARLEEEVLRARTFGRPLSVLMVRALGERSVRVRHFLPAVRAPLRPVDAVGLYGPGMVLAALPETGAAAALALARRLVDDQGLATTGAGALVVGVAELPASASTAEELVARAREAAHLAGPDDPVREAARSGDAGPGRELPRLVVADPRMRALYDTVTRVARSVAPVLIVGETGTGKELFARALHQQSARASGPMRCVNCGAIPPTLVESTLFGHERGAFTGADQRRPGLFEEAGAGTVFLDEVGELPGAAQAALLRVLETKRFTRVGSVEEVAVDVRIVAATHRDLEAMCRDGSFRLDLLYRLNTITLEVPPLRERRGEVEPLATLFAEVAARESQIPPRPVERSALELLRAYDWPGNVRELRNVVERAVVIAQGTSITADDLPERVRLGEPRRPTAPAPEPPGPDPVEFKDRVRQYETELILDALRRTSGNQTLAARHLRMPLRTLVHKIKLYGLQKRYER